jgi:double-GTPase-like protein
MAKYPKIREQHIAVFGESGSGKTVLASSFYGPTQEKSSSSGLWDLVADDTGQGTRLYKNYLGMRDHATAPAPTRFAGTTYSFSLKLKGGGNAKAKKRPFDILRVAWHDYPGEWFEESPSSEGEARRRVATFRSLLRSDVALVLVDGQKLLDFRGEEERYLKSLLTNIRQGLLRLKEDLLAGDGRLVDFPRIWIIALSKADLFPEWDVYSFRDLVIWNAADHIERLRATLQEFVVSPEALSMGEDFMLLSSAKFELSSAGPEPAEIDVTKRVGIDLILPVASLLPLEHLVQWQEKIKIPMKVLDTLADDTLANVLISGMSVGVGKVVAMLPKVGPLASKAAMPALAAALKTAESQLRQINAQAREKHDYLTAALTQFKLDLDQGETDRLLIRSK